MSNLEDPESVGQKLRRLSGTFLGIFLAYGVEFQLRSLLPSIKLRNFFIIISVQRSVSGFATGLSPIMAVEIGRRSLDKLIQPTADELEEKCKEAAKGGWRAFPDQVKSKGFKVLVLEGKRRLPTRVPGKSPMPIS